MGILQSYGFVLLRHPGKVLFVGISSVLVLFIVTICSRTSPSFEEPLVGFEARNTPISAKINTWNLLIDESSAIANNITHLPALIGQDTPNSIDRLPNDLLIPVENSDQFPEPPIIEESTQNVKNNVSNGDIFDEDEEEYYRTANSTLDRAAYLVHFSLGSQKAFCGKIYNGYAQIVVSSTARNSNSGLFNLNSMLSICQLDNRLRLQHSVSEVVIFEKDCERYQLDGHSQLTPCCNSWSLPNYIACLNNKTSCSNLDHQDIKNTAHLLDLCAPYYFKAPHEECFYKEPKRTTSDISSKTQSWSRNLLCGSIPEKCLRCDGWIYTVMNYLVNENFIHHKTNKETHNRSESLIKYSRQMRVNSSNRDTLVRKLSYTNVFLPLAKSASLLKYYQTLSKYPLKTKYAQVRAMDLGLKDTLFEQLVFDDAKLFIIALTLILFVIALYTWSVILSFVILLIICLAICLSYVIYEVVLAVPIFPFMNLLAVVISFGICSDNAMLFCKHWSQEDQPIVVQADTDNVIATKRAYKEQVYLERMLTRAILSTSVATFATACSFIISAISRVTAIRCFCIFATLTVLTNYFLIVLLLPPALILDHRFSEFIRNRFQDTNDGVSQTLESIESMRVSFLTLGDLVHKEWIFKFVTKFKFYLIVTSLTALACASILVFYTPTLQPPDKEFIQLLSSNHAFEQYDKTIKRQFAFERSNPRESVVALNPFFDKPDTLPVRVVFGVKPTDNGNLLDPQDRGSLVFDPSFDLSDPSIQSWMREFCLKLRQQRFIHPTSGPDSANCFIEWFRSWMESRSCRDPILTDLDRSPCCQNVEFPYKKQVFDQCIGEAVSIMRKTPQFQPNPNAGLLFFKNTSRVAAMIIEYQSNRLYSDSFTKMERFYYDIDEWVTWHINNTAPPGLKSGWFTSSDLDLLALQTELDQSTISSIFMEVVFAMLALFLGTRNILLTLAGSLTIGTIIIVTVGILISLKWTLGVAESIFITLIIGLSIDFALHYCVAFSESKSRSTNGEITHKILSEVGSPIALATITTSLAGCVIVWSDILAYQQLGIFLMLIALTSWITSTFFLLPMLETTNMVMKQSNQYAKFRPRRVAKLLLDRL